MSLPSLWVPSLALYLPSCIINRYFFAAHSLCVVVLPWSRWWAYLKLTPSLSLPSMYGSSLLCFRFARISLFVQTWQLHWFSPAWRISIISSQSARSRNTCDALTLPLPLATLLPAWPCKRAPVATPGHWHRQSGNFFIISNSLSSVAYGVFRLACK